MVERQISSSQEIEEHYDKVGVVVFVFNQMGEVLVVQENFSAVDERKQEGEFGVVCETSEEGESWEETVIRGFEEEIGLKPLGLFYGVDPDHCFLGESLFVENILARVVVLHWLGDSDVLSSITESGEVSVIGWEEPEDLVACSSLRRGVRKILQECLDEDLFEGIVNISRESILPLSISNLEEAGRNF